MPGRLGTAATTRAALPRSGQRVHRRQVRRPARSTRCADRPGCKPERGELLSTASAREIGPGDPRSRFPRFQGENLRRNLDLLATLESIAAGHGVTTAQLAIAWVLSRGGDIVPLIGTKRRDRLADAQGALDVTLSPAEIAAIEAAVPPGQVAGERYDPAAMAALDSGEPLA